MEYYQGGTRMEVSKCRSINIQETPPEESIYTMIGIAMLSIMSLMMVSLVSGISEMFGGCD